MAQVSGLAKVCEKAGSVVDWLSALVSCFICFVCVYRAPTKIANHSVTFEKAEMRTNWRTADGIQSQKRMRKQAAATQVNMIPTSFPAQPTLIEPNKRSQPGLSSFL